MQELNFTIAPGKPISDHFLERDITDFQQAASYIRGLPYRRNSNKYDLTTAFTDGCGTCGTKHALLKQLADENGLIGVKLIMGIFKMDANYAPKIAGTLERSGLEYIPEAHNYLSFNSELYDLTTPKSKPDDFNKKLLVEIEIQPDQITDFKVAYHKEFLGKWIAENKVPYDLDELWRIREQCIADMAS